MDAGTAFAEEIGGTYVQGDIADDQSARDLVATAIEQHGRLDVLVNNAGITQVIPHDDLEAVTDEVWERILGTNLIGTWHVVRGRASSSAPLVTHAS